MASEQKVGFQRSNWSQRPLPSEMISYAATDSRYLIYLRYTLLCIALEGPSEKLKKEIPDIRGKLTVKQLSKLYSRMQKDDWNAKDKAIDPEKALKKAIKTEDVQPDMNSVCKFFRMFSERNEYCMRENINPEYI